MNNYNNNTSGYNFIALASSLAVLLGEQFDGETLAILSTFFCALGDNLGIVSSTKQKSI